MNMIKLPIEKDELIHLLPHKGKMFLIERITACDINEWNVTSETIVRDTCLFYDKNIDGIPNYVCFELMAQTISALTGIIIREKNLPVNMGFILSVSAIKFSLPVIKKGQTVTITARRTGEVDNVYTFEASLTVDGNSAGGGKLTVLEVKSL